MIPRGFWEAMMDEVVRGYGGYVNAHSHLDRANTLDHKYLVHYGLSPLEAASRMSLPVKQNLTGELHRGPAYAKDDLEERMRQQLDQMVADGVREVVSFIDATPDIGLTAISVAATLREEYRERIRVKIAAHPIFGFKADPEHEKTRWDVLRMGVDLADIIGGLPEKDDRPDSIGADEHIRRLLLLGREVKKEVHIHVDQENDPRQRQTLDLIEAVHWIGSPEIQGYRGPTVWAVHCISPSAYPEDEFREVVEGLQRYNIGIVCCPRAALSMRQPRPLRTPAHNSVARVLEMAISGVYVRLGTDNISDIFVPTYATMLDEVRILADTIRFYDIAVLAKLAAGIPLNRTDESTIRLHLEEERKAFAHLDPSFVSFVNNLH